MAKRCRLSTKHADICSLLEACFHNRPLPAQTACATVIGISRGLWTTSTVYSLPQGNSHWIDHISATPYRANSSVTELNTDGATLNCLS